MFTLYARPGSGSAAVEALLCEVGAEFVLEDVPRGAVSPDYLKLNPRGEIPTLRLHDDSVMTESAAMMIYLADLFHDAGLAPALKSPQRAAYLRWMLYFASSVYMADLRYFYAGRYSTDASHADAIKVQAALHMERDIEIFAGALGHGPFVLGATFSAVDIYVAMLVSWMPDLDAVCVRHPNIAALYRLVAARPKIAPVWLRNDMPALTALG
jgi:glutathione S-transferase